MFDTLFNKSGSLSKIDVETINTSDSTRITALKFSQSLLFLTNKLNFSEKQLGEFHDSITNADLNKFVLGYTHLVTNGFQASTSIDSHYKSFEDIFANAISTLAKTDDKSKHRNLVEIIHLLLLNPKLDLSSKFSLNPEEATKMGIEHIFSMWVAAEEGVKKQNLSNLLTHFIAITPDVTAITPNAKLHCAYTLLSLFTYSAIKRFLNHTNFLSQAISMIDIIEVLPMVLSWSTALTVGYFITLHRMDTAQSKSTISINPDYMSGTFAVGIPFVLKPSSILKRMEGKLVEGKAKPDESYTDSYITRKLLLTKYAGIKAYLCTARRDIKFQLGLGELAARYDTMTAPNGLILEGDAQDMFINFTQRTFNEANFNNIIKELASPDKKEYFLKVYDIVEKGFIKLDLQTMYVIHEVFNQVCYNGYESTLTKSPSKLAEDFLTFESFQYSFDTLLLKKDNIDIPLSALGSENNNSTTVRLKAHGCKLDLKKLKNLWKQVLKEFDQQYLPPEITAPQEEKLEEKKAGGFTDMNSVFEKGSSMFQEFLSQKLDEKKGVINSLKLFGWTTISAGCTIILLKPTIRPVTIFFMVIYTADHYYHPQIIGLKEFGQKLCSGGYTAGNDVYKGVVSWKSSYMASKQPPKEDEQIMVS